MNRLQALAAHPRRTLGALAVVLAAAGITAGSGADFTAASANPANTFSTGTLSIGNTKSSAILSASGLKPGGSTEGTVDIENTGTLAGAFSLATSGAQDSTPSLLGQLDLKIIDCGTFTGSTAPTCGTTALYDGKISAMTSKSLGNYSAGAKHRYKFEVSLPSSTDNTLQGKTASVAFNWTAAA
jgi:spore coat-associated protein N